MKLKYFGTFILNGDERIECDVYKLKRFLKRSKYLIYIVDEGEVALAAEPDFIVDTKAEALALVASLTGRIKRDEEDINE